MNKWNYYSVVCAFSGICMFLYGFFLLNFNGEQTPDIFDGTEAENIPIIATGTHTTSKIEKLVIMVIDALRYDFVAGQKVSNNMPFTYSSIVRNQTCVFPCRVHLPTVTMPRIKALTVGTVPSFLDIVMNFGSTRLFQDNILAQITKAGKKIVFYGDETWLKLFPDLFHRYEGTTSFFVSDFVEVDYNVTRNVDKEIKNNDWDVIILHYLGLDHIGHVEGPTSSKVPAKLREMDLIVEKLNHYLTDWQKVTNQNYMMIVCGDHGMKDSGGHGGSTLPEVMVPFVTFGVDCTVDGEISQVDVAVTLSALLRLPIPRENVGKLISGLVRHFSMQDRLEALDSNAKHLLQKYEKISDKSSKSKMQKQFDIARRLRNDGDLNESVLVYESLLELLSSKLIYKLTKFDLMCLYPAIVLVIQALFIPNIALQRNYSIVTYTLLLAVLILFTIYQICSYAQCDSVLCDFSSWMVLTPMLTTVFLSLNTVLMLTSGKYILEKVKEALAFLKRDSILTFLILGSVLQICSTISTSFIEEEHMVWYFLWTTFLVLMFLKPDVDKSIAIYVLLLVSHRIMCKLNQTGDNWASLPDINGWFKVSHRAPYLSVYAISGLLWTYFSLSYFSGKQCGRCKRISYTYDALMSLSRYLDASCLMLVYLYRAAVTDVMFFEQLQNRLSHRGITEFRIYCYVFLISLILKSTALCFPDEKREKLGVRIVEIVISSWMILNALLLRSYNIVLIGSLAVTSDWLTKILWKEPNKDVKLVLAYHWLAHVYFFYQGNSNSLASIDISAGYIGQESYNQVVAAVLIVSCCYAMPIFAYLCMLRHFLINVNYEEERKKKYSMSK